MKFIIISTAVMLVLLGIATVALTFGYKEIMFASATSAVLPIAAGLYRLRFKNKLAYGGFEFVVAIGFFYFLTRGIYTGPYEPLTFQLFLSQMMTFFAAIYFMVRALDNIGQGLNPALTARWKQFFEE